MTTDNESACISDHRSINSVGALLREARESLGFDLPDAARGLRIRLVYLQYIETDNYAQLPGKTYVLGFLRSYAEFLGLDGDDVVARYRRQLDDKTLPSPTLNFPIREPEARMPRGAILLLSVVLAAGAVYGGARYLGDDKLTSVERVAPVPDRLVTETKPAPVVTPRNDPSSAFAAVTPQPSEAAAGGSVLSQPAPSAPAAAGPVTEPVSAEPPAVAAPTLPPAVVAAPPAPAEPDPVIAPAPPLRSGATTPPPKPAKLEVAARPEPVKPELPKPTPQQQTQALNQAQTQTAALPPPRPRDIVVVARVDSWIEVRDANNSPLVSLLLRVGDSYRVPEGSNYRLVTGDVRGLEVRVDGVAVRQRGADDNKPHRTLSLDGERLRSGNAVAD